MPGSLLKKVTSYRSTTFLKRNSYKGVFLEMSGNLLEKLFHRTLVNDRFWYNDIILFVCHLTQPGEKFNKGKAFASQCGGFYTSSLVRF